MQGDKMRQSGRTTLFVLVCIAVLCAAYGVGLGVRNLRMAGFRIDFSMGDAAAKPVDKPEPASESKPKADREPAAEVVSAKPEPAPEAEPAVAPPAEPTEPQTAAAEPVDLRAKEERLQDLPDAERQETRAQRRRSAEDRGRGEGRGGAGGGGRAALQQLSEEDRADFRAKMEALTAQARAGELSEDEMRQARAELLQEYGINPQARGGRRPGGRQ